MAWKIEYADSVLKQLKKLDKHAAKQIVDYLEKKIGSLDDPTTAGKPLSGTLATFWRYRVGDYRVICHLEKESITVLVLRVSHRKDAYEDEEKIATKATSEVSDFRKRKEEEKDMEVENSMPSDFQPESTGILKLGGLKSLSVNFIHDTRITIPIPTDHHSFQELDAVREEGNWKNVVLSTISFQLKSWPSPKVRTYSFMGKVIRTEQGDSETLITLDKYGEVKLTDVAV